MADLKGLRENWDLEGQPRFEMGDAQRRVVPDTKRPFGAGHSRCQSIVCTRPRSNPYLGNEIAEGYARKCVNTGPGYYQCGTTIVPFRNEAAYYSTKVVDNR